MATTYVVYAGGDQSGATYAGELGLEHLRTADLAQAQDAATRLTQRGQAGYVARSTDGATWGPMGMWLDDEGHEVPD